MYSEIIYGFTIGVVFYLIALENPGYKKNISSPNVLPVYNDECFEKPHISIIMEYSSQDDLDLLV